MFEKSRLESKESAPVKPTSLKFNRPLLSKNLAIFLLVFVFIGGYILFSSFAATPVVASLQAEQMSLPRRASIINDNQASGGKAVRFTKAGSANGTVTIPAGSQATSMTVIAKATQCRNKWPQMGLKFDGVTVTVSTSVAKTGWTAYSFNSPNQKALPGKHTVSISALNVNQGRCSHQLYVDDVVLYGPVTAPVVPIPTIAFSASPASITAGQPSTLTWRTTNATSCTATGSWNGAEATSGSISTGALNGTATYSLLCKGSGGSATASVTITVTPPVQITPPPVSTSQSLNAAPGITPGATFENLYNTMTTVQKQAVIATMKADGVKWLRLDAAPNQSFNPMIIDAAKAGIKVDAAIQAWGIADTPAAMASFATSAVQTLEPYGVTTYEVLNEPNGCEYQLTAAQYTAILQATYKSVKAVDPTATVITAGMCPSSNEPYTYLTAMYAAGAKGYFDAFNMHPYSAPDTPLQTTDAWNPWSYLGQLHNIMTANGDGAKPIWLTEFGCPTGTVGGWTAYCTDATLANQITLAYQQAKTLPWVGPLMIYDWQDLANGDDFGLYNTNGTPKALSVAAFILAAKQN